MEKIKGYETAKVIQESEKLPTGGYIIGILDVQELSYDWGKVLEAKFDIADGEYKNFYTNQFKNSQMEDKKYKGVYRMNVPKGDGSEKDEWTIRKFKSDITAIEESNGSYHWDWDEKKLVGKKVGCVMFEKQWEYNGDTGFFTTCHSFKSVEIIKSGKYKIPKPKMLKEKEADTKEYPDVKYTEVSTDDDLPF